MPSPQGMSAEDRVNVIFRAHNNSQIGEAWLRERLINAIKQAEIAACNEAVMECIKDDTREAASVLDIAPRHADTLRSSAMHHEQHLKPTEAVPVEPSKKDD